MSNGQGCTCNAWSENECACGADWTPQEVYALRAENNRLKAENKLYAAEMSAAKENGFYSAQELFMAYQNAEEELAEAKKDAELWREREAKIKSLKERGFLKSPLRDDPYKVVMKGK